MMKQYLMVRIADGVITGTMLQDDPDIGPLQRPASPVPDGIELIVWPGEFNRTSYPDSYEAQYVDGDVMWVDTTTLDDLKARKSAAMSQACGDAITSGFHCDALGAGFTYPSKANDQANLTGSVLRSMYSTNGPDWRTPFWCADADGAWEFRLHTAAQIQQVGDCAVNARLTCMATNERLQGQIAAARTHEAINEINW